MKSNLTLTKFVVLFLLTVIFIVAFPDCNGNKNTIVGTYPDEIFDSSKEHTYTLQWIDSTGQDCIKDGLSLKEIDSIKNTLK